MRRRIGWTGPGDVAATQALQQLQGLGVGAAPGGVEPSSRTASSEAALALRQVSCSSHRAVQLAAGEQQREHLPAQLEIVGCGGQGVLEILRGAAQVAGIQRRTAGQVAAGGASRRSDRLGAACAAWPKPMLHQPPSEPAVQAASDSATTACSPASAEVAAEHGGQGRRGMSSKRRCYPVRPRREA